MKPKKLILQWFIIPLLKLINKLDLFIIQCYFVFFYKKEITSWYAHFIKTSVDGWRIASELQCYYFLITDTYQLQPIFKMKQTFILPGLFNKKNKKKLYIKYPVFGRMSAKKWFNYINDYYKIISQKAESKKPGRNEICCEKGLKAKKCTCIELWHLPNPEQPTVHKLQPFKKRPKDLINPFF